MARALGLAVALAAPCSAFLPQGSLRSQAAGFQEQAVLGVQQPVATASSASATLAALGVAAAAAAGASALGVSSRARKTHLVARHVAGVTLPLTQKWDPLELGMSDAKMERYTAVEIKHGRISMIACVGYVMPEIFRFPGCEDGMFGQTPVSLLKEGGWWGTSVDYIVKDIPICGGAGGCALPTRSRASGLTAMRATIYQDPNPGRFMPEKKMSAAMPFLKYPEPLEGWVGGEKGFDPLNVTMALPTYLTREAELKHARVCMLATIGWIATDLGARFPSPVFQNTSTTQAHDTFVANGYMGIGLAVIGCMELYGGFLFFEGWEQNIKRDAGDFFFGKNFLPKDEEGANNMKLKELENGRLAMLAFSGIVTQAAIFPDKTFPFL